MELIKSKTLTNLARSFAGESQAGLRYQLISQKALQQGYKVLSDEIKKLAKNEVNHAKVFYNHIIENAGNLSNIDICAGYPYEGNTLEESLKFAMENEDKEGTIIYPEFERIARNEGFVEVAESYALIAQVEIQHKATWQFLYENFKNGTLYKTETPVFWKCSECGHIETRNEAWDICPLCQSPQGFVQLHLQ